jgi:hypothetical protein
MALPGRNSSVQAVGSVTGGADKHGLSKQRNDLFDFPDAIADLVALHALSRRDRRSRRTPPAFQTRPQVSSHWIHSQAVAPGQVPVRSAGVAELDEQLGDGVLRYLRLQSASHFPPRGKGPA